MRAIPRLGLDAFFALFVLVGLLGRVVSDNAAWPLGERIGGEN